MQITFLVRFNETVHFFIQMYTCTIIKSCVYIMSLLFIDYLKNAIVSNDIPCIGYVGNSSTCIHTAVRFCNNNVLLWSCDVFSLYNLIVERQGTLKDIRKTSISYFLKRYNLLKQH